MLWRLVLSYAAVLIIPGGLLAFVVNTSVLSTIREQAVVENQLFLERGMRQAERLFFELERIGVSIAQNHLLSRFELQKSPQARIRAVNQMRNYRFVTGEIYDLLYYPFGDERVYSSYGYAEGYETIGGRYRFEPTSVLNSLDALTRVRQRFLESEQVAVVGDDHTVILFPYIWPVYAGDPHAIVVFLIRADSARALFTEGAPVHTSSFEITNLAGDPIAFWATGAETPPTERESNVLEYTVHSRPMGLTFRSVVREDLMMRQIRDIERHLGLAFAAVFATGVCLILFGLHTSYGPVARLVRVVSTAFGLDPHGGDEMSLVQHALTSTADANRRLHSRINSLKPILRAYVLRELIGSSSPFIDHPAQVSFLLGPDEGYESVHVVAVVTPSNAEIRRIVLDAFGQDARDDSLAIVPIADNTSGYLVFLISEKHDDQTRLREGIEKVSNAIAPVEPPPGTGSWTIGVGTFFSDILDAGQSYAAAMEQVFSARQNECASSAESHSSDAHYTVGEPGRISQSAADRLRHHLEAGDHRSIRDGLEKARRDLSSSSSPQFLSRCMIYDLFNTVLRVASERHVDIETVLGPDAYVFVTRTHQTIDALFEALERACANLTAHIGAADDSASLLVARALDVIGDRHADRSFSVELLADELGVTVPYLSRVFKEYRGETISDYVWSLRLAHAKEMLGGSSVTVQDIAHATGYTDVSAFIRRFRKETGLSPGKYRSQTSAIHERELELSGRRTHPAAPSLPRAYSSPE